MRHDDSWLVLLFVGSLAACETMISPEDVASMEASELNPVLAVDGEVKERVELMPGQEVDLEVLPLDGFTDLRYAWATTNPDAVLTADDDRFAEFVAGNKAGTHLVVCEVRGKDQQGETKRTTVSLVVEVKAPNEIPSAIINYVLLGGDRVEDGGTVNVDAGQTVDVVVQPVAGTTDLSIHASISEGRLLPISTESFGWRLPTTPGVDLMLMLDVIGKVDGELVQQQFTQTIHLQ
jgi:hypothetical protein